MQFSHWVEPQAPALGNSLTFNCGREPLHKFLLGCCSVNQFSLLFKPFLVVWHHQHVFLHSGLCLCRGLTLVVHVFMFGRLLPSTCDARCGNLERGLLSLAVDLWVSAAVLWRFALAPAVSRCCPERSLFRGLLRPVAS